MDVEANTEKDQDQSYMARIKLWMNTSFVDLVNPKFKSFNKPVLLALCVMFVTVIGFIITLTSIVNDCQLRNYVASGWQIIPVDDLSLLESGDYGDDRRRRLTEELTSGCDVGDGELCGMPTHSCIYGVLSNQAHDTNDARPFFADPSEDDVPRDMDQLFVQGSLCVFETVAQDVFSKSNYCEPLVYDYATHVCDGKVGDTGMGVEQAMFTILYRECPEPVAALGAAFGWVGMIESFAGIFFIAILYACGVLENDNSSFKDIVTGMLEEGLLAGPKEELGNMAVAEMTVAP